MKGIVTISVLKSHKLKVFHRVPYRCPFFYIKFALFRPGLILVDFTHIPLGYLLTLAKTIQENNSAELRRKFSYRQTKISQKHHNIMDFVVGLGLGSCGNISYKALRSNDIYMLSFSCHMIEKRHEAKPLSKPMLTYFHFDPYGYNSAKSKAKYNNFHFRKFLKKNRNRNVNHFVSASMW